ncbi:MAG TPA: DUF1015 domain-containing protein [Candidatus Limnocylindrales bacterium]|nr:DUF1015 domain-containing protein [Candidatus Limnocylindrales bacterium]
MPVVRPFRALRYAPDAVPDLASVVAPPYDVIGPDEVRELLARDPRNVVRLDLPIAEPGDEPDERYRRAARLISTWRSDGTLHRDPRPALYAYEQAYTIPGTAEERVRRGVFARVGLEAFGPDSGIRPHERTLAEPREDRYRLLRATGVNTSPIVGMYDDPTGRVPEWLAALPETATAEVIDDHGVQHRLWMVAEDLDLLDDISARIGAGPITLADGHHRYETALRYRDERMTGAVEHDAPAWAEILMLLLEPVQGPITVLATHRVLQELDGAAVDGFLGALPELFDVEAQVDAAELAAAFRDPTRAAGGAGRLGLWTRQGGLILRARRPAFGGSLPPGGRALRGLDVTLAGIVIERLAGIDDAAVAEGARIAYTHDPADAIAWVTAGQEGASIAILLEPTPARDIVSVAAEGDLMPQKSTYIYPKALTGLVINPLE